MKHVRFITLGCRVNQYETQAMREALASENIFDPAEGRQRTKTLQSKSSDIDFVVINTCTVTSGADKENKYWIRRARREHPEAKIVVTGCFVEKNREEVEALREVDLVVGNYEKAEISDLISDGCAQNHIQDSEVIRQKKRTFSPLTVSEAQGKSRAYIKIQDGCNHACSFCKVVMVRGRSRSRTLESIREEAKRLSEAGHLEVVLAGIQLGAYGHDLEEPVGLVDAIRVCAEVSTVKRIRLSSIEPTDVTPELIETMKREPKCCPHLHIPLQSGDDRILEAMNRRYDRNFYRDLIKRIRQEIPDFCLSLDVMAGFPGETREQFENTMDLLREVRPVKSHVFPYSAREGTRAFSFENLPGDVIRDRVRELGTLTDNLAKTEGLQFVGKTVPVIVEQRSGESMLMQGTAHNFIKVYFQGTESMIGKILLVKLLTFQGKMFLGKIVEEKI